MISYSRKIILIITILIISTYFIISNVSAAEECTSCHKIKHGSTGDNCENCHYNTTVSKGKHIEKPFSPGYMHDGFDWEGDNLDEKGEDRLNESCPVCHVSMLEHTSPKLNACEDCHVKGTPQIGSIANLRSDITKYIPMVYSHYNGSSIDVPDQSFIGNAKSSCFGFDSASGEGSCHGVTFANKVQAGGFFSINTNYTDVLFNRGDPYHWNAPVDFMPDSKNCVFCHLQEDAGIKKAWGNPRYLPPDSAHLNTKNKDCWSCHVEGQLKSFHGKEVVKIVEKSNITNYLTISLLILIGIVILLWRKQK